MCALRYSLSITKQNPLAKFKATKMNSSNNIIMNSSTIGFKEQLIDNIFFIVEYNNKDKLCEVIHIASFTKEYMINIYIF